MTSTSGAPARVYYGWWVLGAVAVAEMLAYGGTTFAAGLFVKPVGAELGISRADANSSIALMHIGVGFAAPLLGFLLDRWSLRPVVVLGALCMAGGLAIISLSASPLVMAAACLFLLSLGFVGNGVLTSTTAVSRWFRRRRGRAMGVVAVASSAGGFIVTPLVSAEIEAFGWRGALQAQAALVLLVVLLLAALVIKDRPADLGLESHPEIRPEPAAKTADHAPSASQPWTYGRILRSRAFWCIGLATSLTSGGVSAILVTLAPFASDLRFDAGRIALLISVLSMCGIATKLAAGWASDLMERRWMLAGGAAALAGALTLLLLNHSFPGLLAAAALTGMALGTTIPAGAGLTADHFGAAAFGRVYGLMHSLGAVFNVVCVRGVGEFFDRTGDYRLAFLSLILTAILAATAAASSGRPRAPA